MLRHSGAVIGRHLALRYGPLGRDTASNQLAHRSLFLRLYSSKDGEDGNSGGILPRFFEKLTGKQADKKDDAADSASNAEASSAASDSNGNGSSADAASENALVPNSPELKHRKVYVVELNRKPLFPGIYTPVLIQKNERLVKALYDAKKQGGQAYVGAFLKRPQEPAAAAAKPKDATDAAATAAADQEQQQQQEEQDAAAHLYEYGTFAQVHTIMQGDTADSAQLLLLGHRRIKRVNTVGSSPLRVGVQHLKDKPYPNDDILKATNMEIVNTMRDLLNLNPLYGEQFRTLMQLTGSIDLNDTSRLIDAAASLTSAEDSVLQNILETLSVPERARLVLELLKKEVELCKLQADIRQQVEDKILKEQRRMLLMEQLKSIKKELGLEKDDKAALIQRAQERWEPKRDSAPGDVQKVVQDELDKLAGLEPSSPEFNVTRNYLDWLISLPWGEYTEEIFDLKHAQKVLDADHYGLEDVKERILEFIAVSKMRGSTQGKILCLVGPPGVGKTSIGRSIAATLNRKYYRFSVGGLYDVAEIKGHRRTYVGAMPGKMVQCLKSTGSSNPLVLIDEIDKLGRGHAGDPASALLELLDPEQNSGFLDHYLDVPIDLSKVLFVCTANVLDTIPGPLLDRMEVIRLAGYATDEKVAIARRYLEPHAAQDAGVPDGSSRITDDAMLQLINEYCREAGVRNLKKQLEKVYRKVALKLVQAQDSETSSSSSETSSQPAAQPDNAEAGSKEDTAAQVLPNDEPSSSASSSASSSKGEIVINSSSLKDYVGPAPFTSDKIYEHTPPGVVMGLAWTAMGGATLYVEAAAVVSGEGKGSLHSTGQLGDVFRESTTIGHTYARAFLQKIAPGNEFFSNTALHVHVPAGATPKDGPSAGCTIVTALLSLALGKPVRPDLAMTGEVTLTGKVLPIGGVKEKTLAARRAGVKHLVFPEGNRRDWEELSGDLQEGLEVHFASSYDDVYKLALGYEEEEQQQVEVAAV